MRFVGRRDRCSPYVTTLMEELESDTASNDRLDLFVRFDYGGRAEIVEAARRLVADGLPRDAVDEAALRERPATPRCLIPTSKSTSVIRISNFMLWQDAYPARSRTRSGRTSAATTCTRRSPPS